MKASRVAGIDDPSMILVRSSAVARVTVRPRCSPSHQPLKSLTICGLLPLSRHVPSEGGMWTCCCPLAADLVSEGRHRGVGGGCPSLDLVVKGNPRWLLD